MCHKDVPQEQWETPRPDADRHRTTEGHQTLEDIYIYERGCREREKKREAKRAESLTVDPPRTSLQRHPRAVGCIYTRDPLLYTDQRETEKSMRELSRCGYLCRRIVRSSRGYFDSAFFFNLLCSCIPMIATSAWDRTRREIWYTTCIIIALYMSQFLDRGLALKFAILYRDRSVFHEMMTKPLLLIDFFCRGSTDCVTFNGVFRKCFLDRMLSSNCDSPNFAACLLRGIYSIIIALKTVTIEQFDWFFEKKSLNKRRCIYYPFK